MLSLKQAALVLAGVLIAAGAAGVFAPANVRDWLVKFPRSRGPAWVLTALDLLWSAWLLFEMPMERFEHLKPLLYVLTPVVFVLIVIFMDELLAARALGGLFVLVPTPLLASAQWHASGWRLVVVVVAYLLAIEGMVLVVSPYQFRKAAARFADTPDKCRGWGTVGLGLGALVGLLGLWVY